jgi:RNA polymerase sigma-70 factor (ECF subfamily)
MRSLATERVLATLDRLSAEQRDVLVLRIVGDLTVAQVAAVVGRSEGAVKALQRRGLEAVRRILSTEGVTL